MTTGRRHAPRRLDNESETGTSIIVHDLSCSDDQSDYICQKAGTAQPVRDTGSPYLIPELISGRFISKSSLLLYRRRYLLDFYRSFILRLFIYIINYIRIWRYMSRKYYRQTIVLICHNAIFIKCLKKFIIHFRNLFIYPNNKTIQHLIFDNI